MLVEEIQGNSEFIKAIAALKDLIRGCAHPASLIVSNCQNFLGTYENFALASSKITHIAPKFLLTAHDYFEHILGYQREEKATANEKAVAEKLALLWSGFSETYKPLVPLLISHSVPFLAFLHQRSCQIAAQFLLETAHAFGYRMVTSCCRKNSR